MAEHATEYHFIITVQASHATLQSSRVETRTVEGTADVREGDTRRQIYKDVRASVLDSLGMPDSSVVLFFSLEPNTLGG